MCIPVAIALVGRDFYEVRAQLSDRVQQVERTHNALLLLYQNDTVLINFEQINPVFFELGKTRLTQIHKREINIIKRDIDSLRTAFSDDVKAQFSLQQIAEKVARYQIEFAELLEQLKRRGFQDYGEVGEMRSLAHNIEKIVSNYPNLMVHALMLRRHEKDYIIRNQASYIDRLVNRSNRFVLAVNRATNLEADDKQNLIALIDQYTQQFLVVVNYDDAIGLRGDAGTYQQILATKAQIESQYARLIKGIDTRSTQLIMALDRQLLGSVIALALLALFVSVYLSRTLTSPLLKLSKRIKVFSDSDFKEPVSLNRLVYINDEVGNLARNFSSLQDHILDSLDKLETERASAEQANNAKSMFLANMSHELRTPLNGIIGMTQLLNTTPLSQEQKSFAETIQHASNGLLTIVSDILDFSKIEAGKIDLEEADFNLNETLEFIAKPFQPEADTKQITLSIDDSNVNVTKVRGDVERWSQIVRNLLSNAMKFTEAGTIQLILESKQQGQNVLVKLQVVDTGVGIARDALDHIFEAFRQEDNTTTRRFGGTGLGLSISSQLCREMRGSLDFKSKQGQGSTFTATAQMHKAQTIGAEAVPKSEPIDLKVLVAEDNVLNQRIIERMPAKLGADATIVENGQDAINELHEHRFDLVLMDIQMPVMDGLTAVAEIHKDKRSEKQLVYALTANATSEDKSNALNAGMDGFITKPISMKALLETLRGLSSSDPESEQPSGGALGR